MASFQTYCVAGQIATSFCANKKCPHNPIICSNPECDCFHLHDECVQLQISKFQKKIDSLTKSTTLLWKEANEWFERVTEKLKMEHEKLEKRSKVDDKLEIDQRKLLELMREGKSGEITKQLVSNVLDSFENVKINQDVKGKITQLSEKLNRQFKEIRKIIERVSRYLDSMKIIEKEIKETGGGLNKNEPRKIIYDQKQDAKKIQKQEEECKLKERILIENKVVTYKNGNVYEGQFKNGMHHGKGTMIWGHGDKYEGEFKKDNPNGKGVYIWADGEKYDGEWKRGMKYGKGINYYVDGRIYEGEWKGNYWDGQGSLVFPNGDRCCGKFKKNQAHGKGTFIWSNGAKFEGDWKNGQKNGEGTMIFVDGRKYEGQWKDDLQQGKGIETFVSLDISTLDLNSNQKTIKIQLSDFTNHTTKTNQLNSKICQISFIGDRFQGFYKKGLKTGKGIFTTAIGQKYQGQFKDDMKHGQGVFTTDTGKIIHQVWKHGKLLK